MIYTARYVLPISSPFIEYGAVVIEDDKILAVGLADEIKAQYPEHAVEDLGLAAIMPGFVDVHTHLEYTIMRGLIEDLPYSQWKYEVMKREPILTDQDWLDSAVIGALEASASGITTIADITTSGASLTAAQQVGLRAFVYREVETMDKRQVDAAMDEACRDIEAWRAQAADDRITVGIAPHSAYSCHPELFKKVAQYAADGTPVAMHLAGSIEEYQFVKYGSSMLGFEVREQYDAEAPMWLPTGVSPVRYVQQWDILNVPNIVAIHCTQVDDDDIEVLAKYDVGVAYCPRCNAKLAMGIAPLNKFMAAGLRIGIGTDSPAASNAMDMSEEMRIGLLVQRAAFGKDRFFSAERFIRLATLHAASVLGIDDKVGSLEPGKQADLIAIDLSKSASVPTDQPESAIVHTAHQTSIFLTMVAGEVVYQRGEWNRIDARDLFDKAENTRKKLRESL